MAATKDPQTDLENIIKRIVYFKNPFDVLDLAPSATTDEIQKKYKKVNHIFVK
jgi:DnaJ-class molecular chaperone